MTHKYSHFLPLPTLGEVPTRGPVYFTAPGTTDGMLERYAEQGATIVEIEAKGLGTASDLVVALQASLPFPSWCGPSPDSMDDAFADLVDLFPFPIMVALRNFPALAERDLPLAGLLIYLASGYMNAFSIEGKQFYVFYCPD